jgi:hypothetical protein
LMPESVWDLSKRCWKYDASERPAANAIADMVAAMERQKLPSGETRRVVFKPADYGDAASGPSVSILLGTGEDPSPLSTVKTLSSTAAEGRQRIRRVKGASRTATVRFAPLDFGPDAYHDAAFSRSEYPEPYTYVTHHTIRTSRNSTLSVFTDKSTI